MNKLKDRYEFLVGLLALIVSLSAFQSEISSIDIPIGPYELNLKKVLFGIIIALLVSLYFFAIERISREYSFGKYKIFGVFAYLAEGILILILLSPVLLGIIEIIFFLINRFSNIRKDILEGVNLALQIVNGILAIGFSAWNARKAIKKRRELEIEQLNEDEIVELDNSKKLFASEFYSQTILECFKVIESHLLKTLKEKDIRVFRESKPSNLIKIAQQQEIITANMAAKLYDLRQLRNAAAHLNQQHTQEQASQAISVTEELLKGTSQ